MTTKSPQNSIPIARPSMGEEEWQALREPIFSGQLTHGKLVELFEIEFALAHGATQGIACSSATTGLHVSLKAMGIGPGDEVIVPAFTWLTTANAVLYCGAIPVFVDISLSTFNINPDLIASALSQKTKAIIAVHLFGRPVDFDEMVSASKNVPIIEDAACAAGSKYKNRMAGSLGKIGVFSFHPRKILTTGEGGMMTTNDLVLAERLRIYRNHGASHGDSSRLAISEPHQMPDFETLGFNYRYTDLQASVGRVQLKKLPSFIARRQQLASRYQAGLADVPWITTPTAPHDAGSLHSWQSFVILVDDVKAAKSRNAIMQELKANGIQTRPGTHAVVNLGYYRKNLGIAATKFPRALQAEAQSIALPLFNDLTDDQQQHVIECLKKI